MEEKNEETKKEEGPIQRAEAAAERLERANEESKENIRILSECQVI